MEGKKDGISLHLFCNMMGRTLMMSDVVSNLSVMDVFYV